MNNYIDTILKNIGIRLQLQESAYKLAEERYQTIADTIQKDIVFRNMDLNIYPHGSFRLKTTVKPLSGDEFDLDFVCELPMRADIKMSPDQLYNHIFRILSTDGIHNNMIEKKSRCIRISYANDFHLDIMPGQQIDSQTGEILVPDRELKQWYHHSNPKKYAEWFEDQARSVIKAQITESRRLQCSAEPIEDQEIVTRLEPLRRAVQLVKRYRDVMCSNNNSEPVRSIIICTLMGKINSSYSDAFAIIKDFCIYINTQIIANEGKPFTVINPVVNEVLSDKWEENPQNYADFVDMIRELTCDLKKLEGATQNTEYNAILKKMFGETVTNGAILEYAEVIGASREVGGLLVDEKGTLNSSSGIPVKNNTFYGER